MTEKISVNFSSGKYPDSEFATFSKQVIGKMTGNVNFPDPNPDLPSLTISVSDFESSLSKMKDGTKEDTVVKNRKRAILESNLKKETVYVETVANGDVAIMLSSGFELTKSRIPIGVLEAPADLTVTIGSAKGSLLVKFTPVEHARFYEIEYTQTPVTDASIIKRFSTTKTKDEIPNLDCGKEYAVRVTSAASDPGRLWCKWVNSYVI
jgi:hypothetical protein